MQVRTSRCIKKYLQPSEQLELSKGPSQQFSPNIQAHEKTLQNLRASTGTIPCSTTRTSNASQKYTSVNDLKHWDNRGFFTPISAVMKWYKGLRQDQKSVWQSREISLMIWACLEQENASSTGQLLRHLFRCSSIVNLVNVVLSSNEIV